VTFSGTSGDVTVSGTVQAGSLAFTSGGYALNSGNVTVGLGAITTDTGTTTINSILEGTAGLIKSGTGALVLTGANTVAGAVSITGGTLQIGSDGALGNAANDVANNGTLKTTSNISLGSERDITGSGSLDIGGGTTLTVNGAFNQTATTLATSGTLDLQGATRSVGNLTVNAAGTVNGSGTISATGLTTGLTSGTASINPGIVFSTGDKTLNVASGATLDLNGALSNGAGSGRIAKTGAGTLILSADNNMGGLRIGAAGSTMTDGGKVILESSVVGSQAQAIQHNFGTLEASTALVMNSGLSIGGRSNGAATLAGGDMEFQGQSTFFRGAGTIGQLALNVNNNTTLLGGLGATSGGGSSTGVTLGGSGTLNISGNSSTFTDTITTADTVKLVVNNTLGAGVNVGSGSLLSGSGKIGAITGAGTVGPGNSPGLLTATSVDPTAGTDFKFEFTALNPIFTSATASGNDLLHLTAASPFAGGTFTAGNVISIYLNSATITNSLLAGTNTTFSGGFFVDGTYGLAAALSPASFAYYTTSSSLGTGSAVDYNGINYYLLDSTIAAKTTLSNTAVASAGFSTGPVAGTLLTFNAVPEPSAQSMLALGMVALVAVRALRRGRGDS
jgi:autotransporter-associated beta strand protein